MPPSLRAGIEEYVASAKDPVRALADVARIAAAAARDTSRKFDHGSTKRALIAGCIRLRDAAEAAEKIGS